MIKHKFTKHLSKSDVYIIIFKRYFNNLVYLKLSFELKGGARAKLKPKQKGMKYSLNLYFNKDSKEYLEKLQKSLARKFRINKFLPSTSIRLGIVDTNNSDKLAGVVEDFISPYKYFKAYLENACIFETPNKIIIGMIVDKGYVTRIERQIAENLAQNGFNKTELNSKLGLFVLLSSNVNVDKKINFKDFEAHIKNCKKEILGKYLTIEGIEILKSGLGKKDALVKRIKLKEY